MAELILKIGGVNDNPSRYQDGDIVCAFNNRRIRTVHAEHLCHVKDLPFNSDGLNPINTLPYYWHELTHQFKFERIARFEIQRTNLLTLESDVINATPNAKGEYMDVPLFIERQKQAPMHRIFGTEGREVWFGGNIDFSHAKLDKVWQKIEQMTPKREVDYQLWPLSSHEKKNFLALPVEDFDEATKAEYEKPEMNGEEIVRKRKHKVDYAVLVSAEKLLDIKDKTIEVDLRREVPLFRSTIVEQKL